MAIRPGIEVEYKFAEGDRCKGGHLGPLLIWERIVRGGQRMENDVAWGGRMGLVRFWSLLLDSYGTATAVSLEGLGR